MQIKNYGGKIPVKRACALMGVSTSGYYEWLRDESSPRRVRDAVHAQHIKEIFEKHHGTYGARRIQQELAEERGIYLSRKKISLLMVLNGLLTHAYRRKRVNTTDSKHNLLIADNLLNRNFAQTEPNKAWVTDTTFILTKEGWLYLTILLDLYSRRIVGWAVGEHIDADLAIRALRSAMAERKPDPGLIVHSDRGSQFASHAFQDALAKGNALSSMSRKGDCWDNACAESFFHTLKVERVYPQGVYASRQQARQDIAAYLLYYNRCRRHSSLGYRSPCAFEKASNFKLSCDSAS